MPVPSQKGLNVQNPIQGITNEQSGAGIESQYLHTLPGPGFGPRTVACKVGVQITLPNLSFLLCQNNLNMCKEQTYCESFHIQLTALT